MNKIRQVMISVVVVMVTYAIVLKLSAEGTKPIFIYITVTIMMTSVALYGVFAGPIICKKAIEQKMEEIGATLVFSKQLIGFNKRGPFPYPGRGSNVIYFRYVLNEVECEGWVRFTFFFIFRDWRL